MSRCIVDSETSPTFKAQLKPFLKRFKKLNKDLNEAILEVQKDYENACDAARPPKRGYSIEVWKFSLKSTDLRRSASTSFRFIGGFLDSPDIDKKRILYLLLFYFKGNKADFTKDELEAAASFLKGALEKQKQEQAALLSPPQEAADSASTDH